MQQKYELIFPLYSLFGLDPLGPYSRFRANSVVDVVYTCICYPDENAFS